MARPFFGSIEVCQPLQRGPTSCQNDFGTPTWHHTTILGNQNCTKMIIIFITTLIGSNGIFYAMQDHTCAIDFTYTIVLHAETTLSRKKVIWPTCICDLICSHIFLKDCF